MKKHILTLFLVPALVLGLSFAFPPEDLPQTPYDESQGFAFENVPRPVRALTDSSHAIQPSQRSARALTCYSPDCHPEFRAILTLPWAALVLQKPLALAVPLRC